MLSVTSTAATLVRDLATSLPHGTGLRIDVDERSRSLRMGLVPGASACDETVVQDGARVFLTPMAAERLFLRTLDAVPTGTHRAFVLDG